MLSKLVLEERKFQVWSHSWTHQGTTECRSILYLQTEERKTANYKMENKTNDVNEMETMKMTGSTLMEKVRSLSTHFLWGQKLTVQELCPPTATVSNLGSTCRWGCSVAGPDRSYSTSKLNFPGLDTTNIHVALSFSSTCSGNRCQKLAGSLI